MSDIAITYMFVTALGLCVGSFINVIIFRLPVILYEEADISLWGPSSFCPKCGTKLKIWHNLPLISFLLLKGKCNTCHGAICITYPIVELSTGLMAVFLFSIFGISLHSLSLLVFYSLLLVMSIIEIRNLVLPNQLTLLLLLLGLLVNLNGIFVSFASSLFGVLVGFLTLLIPFESFKLLRGVKAVGKGDMKLLAAIGAWVGYQQIAPVLLVASLSGLFWVSFIMSQKSNRTFSIAPHLSIGVIPIIYLDFL